MSWLHDFWMHQVTWGDLVIFWVVGGGIRVMLHWGKNAA